MTDLEVVRRMFDRAGVAYREISGALSGIATLYVERSGHYASPVFNPDGSLRDVWAGKPTAPVAA